jgi:hypothetical protein
VAIGASSYGSVAEVAALVGRYTEMGSFSSSTRPTTLQVEKFIDRISAVVNVLLAEQGFVIPVSAASPKLAVDEFVVAQVVQLAHGANGAGPFAPGAEELRDGRTPFQIILKDAAAFFDKHADGLEALGATRSLTHTNGLACRTVDDSGEDIHPIFQRKQFANRVFDWDIE